MDVPTEPTLEMLIAGCTALSTQEAKDAIMAAQLSGGGNNAVARTKMRLRWIAMVTAAGDTKCTG